MKRGTTALEVVDFKQRQTDADLVVALKCQIAVDRARFIASIERIVRAEKRIARAVKEIHHEVRSILSMQWRRPE